MGAPAFQRVLEYPGRLSFGCTNFTTDWPHGGTGMGFCDEVVLTILQPVHLVRAEELAGAAAIDGVVTAEEWFLTCVLRDADSDAIEKVFLNTAVGTVTQHRGIATPGTNRAGYALSARATVICFTPESVIQGAEDQHDMAVLYRALPSLQATAALEHRLGKERRIPLAFWSTPNAASLTGAIKRRRDLTNP